MRAILTAIVFAMLFGVACANPVLTKEQAGEIASVVLSAKENEEYRHLFKIDQISYNQDEGVWRFPSLGQHTLYIFEIRDKDGYYKLGVLTARTFGPAPPKFRISPKLRPKIKELMKEFTSK